MTTTIEPAAAVAASALSASGALIMSSNGANLPLPDMLMAFAGASLILSFMRPEGDGKRNLARAFFTVIFCTVLGVLFGSYVAAWMGFKYPATLGAPFAIGAIGQVAIPLLIERAPGVVDRLLTLLPRKGGGQ